MKVDLYMIYMGRGEGIHRTTKIIERIENIHRYMTLVVLQNSWVTMGTINSEKVVSYNGLIG